MIKPAYRWSGRLPTACLTLLPAVCRSHRLACITDIGTWTSIWNQWRGDETQPRIDFASQLVVIVHNARFINRIRFLSASIADSVLTIKSLETRTARPIRDELYCLVMVFETADVAAISDGMDTLSVQPHARL